jgi:beta-lactamase class C
LPPNNDVTVGYGWFIDKEPVDGNTIVSKDGGDPGFTSWIGLQQKASEGDSSPYGLAILVNGPNATYLGRQCLRVLMGSSQELVIPERAAAS